MGSCMARAEPDSINCVVAEPVSIRKARSREFRARGGVLCSSAVIRLPLQGGGFYFFLTVSDKSVMIGKSVSPSMRSE